MLNRPPSEKQLINSWCFKLFNLTMFSAIDGFFDDTFSSLYIYILWWCYLKFIMAWLHSLMMLFEGSSRYIYILWWCYLRVHQGISTFVDDAFWGFIKVYLHSLMMLFEGSSRYINIRWWCLLRVHHSLMMLFEFHHGISTFIDDAIWGSSWHVTLWWCFLRFIMGIFAFWNMNCWPSHLNINWLNTLVLELNLEIFWYTCIVF